MARSTIGRGVEEIEERGPVETRRVRRPGGGRKTKRAQDSTLLPDLERLVEPATRGDPMRVLLDIQESAPLVTGVARSGTFVLPSRDGGLPA
jgi:hypothetical protein